MERNALVSVFLRILEYNGGILMLTSNRVGSFDEAFKSRIQLALHYPNLTGSQRRKIWRNFLARVHKLDPESIEYEDFLDDHLDEIVKEDMNGRQIRNVITIGRQLAQYKDQKFNFEVSKLLLLFLWAGHLFSSLWVKNKTACSLPRGMVYMRTVAIFYDCGGVGRIWSPMLPSSFLTSAATCFIHS